VHKVQYHQAPCQHALLCCDSLESSLCLCRRHTPLHEEHRRQMRQSTSGAGHATGPVLMPAVSSAFWTIQCGKYELFLNTLILSIEPHPSDTWTLNTVYQEVRRTSNSNVSKHHEWIVHDLVYMLLYSETEYESHRQTGTKEISTCTYGCHET